MAFRRPTPVTTSGGSFCELGNTAIGAPERSFQALASDHATLGGINEQALAHLINHGVFETLSDGLDAVMRRITAAPH
jgi:pyrroline-5-carboxylate reductase